MSMALTTPQMLRRLHITDGYSPLYASSEMPEKEFSKKRYS
jgi:hypothetical protein